MSGSTGAAREIGSLTFQERMQDPMLHLLISTCEANNGCFMKDSGDGILAAFQHAQDAIDAAVAV